MSLTYATALRAIFVLCVCAHLTKYRAEDLVERLTGHNVVTTHITPIFYPLPWLAWQEAQPAYLPAKHAKTWPWYEMHGIGRQEWTVSDQRELSPSFGLPWFSNAIVRTR